MDIKPSQAIALRELFRTPTFRLFLELIEDYQVEATNKMITAPTNAVSYSTYVAHLSGIIKGLEYIQKVELTLENIVQKANRPKGPGEQ